MKSQSAKEISDYTEVLGADTDITDFIAESLKPYDLEERTALFAEEAKELHLIFAKIYRG